MHVMPKKIDPAVKETCVRQMLEHLPEYSSLTTAAEVVARREELGKETVRRWVVQAQIDGGHRQGATSEELAEIKELKAKVRRLEEDNKTLRRASIFFAGGTRPPESPDRRADLPRVGASQPDSRSPNQPRSGSLRR
jgi:transposase